MQFAHLKRILRLGRLRLRGPRGAQFEFTWAAIAQNLRRLAKLAARPPPETVVACMAQALRRVRSVQVASSVCAPASRPLPPMGKRHPGRLARR